MRYWFKFSFSHQFHISSNRSEKKFSLRKFKTRLTLAGDWKKSLSLQIIGWHNNERATQTAWGKCHPLRAGCGVDKWLHKTESWLWICETSYIYSARSIWWGCLAVYEMRRVWFPLALPIKNSMVYWCNDNILICLIRATSLILV